MKRMKANSMIGLVALALAAAAGCTRIDDNRLPNGPTALMNVDAGLGTTAQKAITRAIPLDDPTLASVEERVEAGYVMEIALDGITRMYKYEKGRFVPEKEPVYFPDANDAEIDFQFKMPFKKYPDGSPGQLLAADLLIARETFSPASVLKDVALIHANSLIEVVLSREIEIDRVEEVFIHGIPAYNIPKTSRYLAIVTPGIDKFTIELKYKGISGYKIVVGKEAVVGKVKKFEPNNRYILGIGIEERTVSLILQVVSVAKWTGEENRNAVTSEATAVILDGDNYISADINVKFTDGSTTQFRTDGNGIGMLEIGDPGDLKVIYSIQRMEEGMPVGKEILIGRAEGETIRLRLDDEDDVVFRDAVNDFIPIGTYAEFALINSGLTNQYLQEADLDLLGNNSVENQNWAPIGPYVSSAVFYPFTGIYDGGGYKIENLYINSTINSIGLFGYCQNSTLRNIHIASGSVDGAFSVGGICGLNNTLSGMTSIIENCTNSAVITSSNTRAGGICGYNYTSDSESQIKILNCHNMGTITGGTGYAGGICGNISVRAENCTGIIYGCSNSGKVIGGSTYTGGICGMSQSDSYSSTTIEGCTNSGSINGTRFIGGICGYNISGTSGMVSVSYCVNKGKVMGSDGGTSVGGVCGGNIAPGVGQATVNNCSNNAPINGSNNVGGICGQNWAYSTNQANGSEATVSACCNTGMVVAISDNAGGVCGYSNSAISCYAYITECYSAASVTGSSNVGGVCGLNFSSSNIIHCFWGRANSNDQSPTSATGYGNAGTSYQFGETDGDNIYWPGTYPITAGYWNFNDQSQRDDANGKWESLGEWSGLPESSTYPQLKLMQNP